MLPGELLQVGKRDQYCLATSAEKLTEVNDGEEFDWILYN